MKTVDQGGFHAGALDPYIASIRVYEIMGT